VNLYYEGPVPYDLPDQPWLLCIKTARVSDISKVNMLFLPCGTWQQFLTALVAYGDKEARDDIRWAIEEAQGIKAISEGELKKIWMDARTFMEEQQKQHSDNKDIDIDMSIALTVGRVVKLRLFPESDPKAVHQVAKETNRPYDKVVRDLKAGIGMG
jgi:hypothetical protein